MKKLKQAKKEKLEKCDKKELEKFYRLIEGR